MVGLLSIAMLAPVPVETPDANPEPISITRMLFLVGAALVIIIILIMVLRWALQKKR